MRQEQKPPKGMHILELRIVDISSEEPCRTVTEAVSLRALSLRFLRNFRKLAAKNTTKLGN